MQGCIFLDGVLLVTAVEVLGQVPVVVPTQEVSIAGSITQSAEHGGWADRNGHCLAGNEVRLYGSRSNSGEEVLLGFPKSPESLSFTCDGQIST